MLAFTRRRNQTIILAGHIRLVIVSVHGNAVRIGIDAPKSVHVRRQELTPKPSMPTKVLAT